MLLQASFNLCGRNPYVAELYRQLVPLRGDHLLAHLKVFNTKQSTMQCLPFAVMRMCPLRYTGIENMKGWLTSGCTTRWWRWIERRSG